jgi:hypothetical protein
MIRLRSTAVFAQLAHRNELPFILADDALGLDDTGAKHIFTGPDLVMRLDLLVHPAEACAAGMAREPDGFSEA